MPDTKDILDLLPPARIAQLLQRHRVVPSDSPVHIETVPHNAGRFDEPDRARFRVFIQNQPRCFLTAGRGEDQLFVRSRAFSEACPAITCQILAEFEDDAFRFQAAEYVDGRDLQTLVLSGLMSSEQAGAIANQVVAELEKTRLPSGIQEAAAELEGVFAQVLSAPMFGTLDKKFLREFIFPFIRAGALTGPFSTRWTNGDFIARNIIVEKSGGARLIDYEFAARTHFSDDDSWRWRTFSGVPVLVESLGQQKSWAEALSILRHLAIAHQTNAAPTAVADAQPIVDRLVRLTGESYGGFRASVFYHKLLTSVSSTSIDQHGACVQLYWSNDGVFTEERCIQEHYRSGADVLINFTISGVSRRLSLRIDPSTAIGIFQLKSVKVVAVHTNSLRVLSSDVALLELAAAADWHRIKAGPTAIILNTAAELTGVALTNDPYIFLPEIAVPADVSEVVCQVRLKFLPDLLTLPRMPPFRK